MKAITGLRLLDVGGWEALAAFIGPNGRLSPIAGCIARIAVVSDGKGVAEVLALAPPSEFLGSCLSDYDWLRRWNRLRVCHPEGSKRQAKASARIERLLARTLKEYLNDADPSAANAALKKAFGRELIKWLDTSSTEDRKMVDGRSKLEIIDMRPLDDDEQKRLSAQYPKWSAAIQDSGPEAYCIEVEGQAIREETGSFWRRPKFLKGLCIACVAGVSGAAIAGAVLHFSRQGAGSLTTPDSESSGILDPLSVSTYTPSEGPISSSTSPKGLIYSDTPSETPMKSYTQSNEATTRNYTSSCDTPFTGMSDTERYKHIVSCDCKSEPSDLTLSCRLVPSKTSADSVMMSARDLAELRIPWKTCEGVYDRTKKNNVSLVDATADAWKTLDWIGDGKVVCVDDRGEDLSCHYFNDPFQYDLPSVWEAVVRFQKPSKCLLADNSDVWRGYLHHLARGRAAAKWIQMDIYDISEYDLEYELGYSFSAQEPDKGCSKTYDLCEIPSNKCHCVEAAFSVEAQTVSGKNVNGGVVRDFLMTPQQMKRKHSLFRREGYTVKSCGIDCLKHRAEPLEDYKNRVDGYLRKYFPTRFLPHQR